tara:strand:+ start:4023 stop:4838 length:816 start_codon:yes stop_codon:yes gene_type:complete
MVKVFEGTDKEYRMDGYLKSDLDHMKQQIKDDWDFVIIVDGLEGAGKSVFAQQIAYYLHEAKEEFSVKNICFSGEEFRKRCQEVPQYSAVIFDESFRGLSSRGTMSKQNKNLVRMLNEVRQRNLYIILVIPSFFELDRYPAIHRSQALYHVKVDKNSKRGFFLAYGVDRKKTLYLFGKKGYNYYAAKQNYYGNYPKHYCVNENEYKKRKWNAQFEDEEEKQEGKFETRYRNYTLILMEELKQRGLEIREIANLLDTTPDSLYSLRKGRASQ